MKFTESELATIERALSVATDMYEKAAEILRVSGGLGAQAIECAEDADKCRALQEKINEAQS